MNLGEFHTLVSNSLRRGTAQDSYIPSQVKLAVQWLERNYTFLYMEVFRLLQLAEGDRTITLPTNTVVKSIKFLRLIDADSAYIPLNMIQPHDLIGLRTSSSPIVPSAFYRVGMNILVLDAVPGSALNGEAVFYEYTDWPTANDSQHDLLNMAADLLLHQTLMMMAAFLRDPAMLQVQKLLRDEALNTMTRAEDEGQYGGAGISMAFSPTGA